MRKRCTKGKSCGATCIVRSDRCVLELGPIISKSLSQVRSKLGVVKLYEKVREQKIKGFQAKFNRIRGELKGEVGGQIRRTADVLELKNRLQKEGLLPKSKKSEPSDLGAIFAKQVEAGKKKEERAPSVPSVLKRQLAALGGGAPAKTTPSERYRRRVAKAEEDAKAGKKPEPVVGRKIERSPGEETKTPQKALKKESVSAMLDDISRVLRGQTPLDIQLGTAPGWSGFKNQFGLTSTGSGSATGNTKWARDDAKDFDGALGKVRREGSKSYNGWQDSYGSGAKKVGEGSFGTVMRNPDGTFVKRGAISDTESKLIERLGKADLGPKLKAADINGKHPYQTEDFVSIKNGRIAMGEVPGKSIGSAAPDKQIGGKNVADIYWKALADLHRLGIAHNDAHIDNILVDKMGKGRWVDLGMAQDNPKAALAEALGAFSNTITNANAKKAMASDAAGQVARGGDWRGNWQTARWNGTGIKELESMRRQGRSTEFVNKYPVLGLINDNRAAVQFALLQNYGLTRDEVAAIYDHGIRSPLQSYNQGPWKKLSDKDAEDLLNMLYDGI